MPSQPTDREMLATLMKKIGALPTSAEAYYNEKGALLDLSLAHLILSHLPSEIGQFTHLQRLFLTGNQLTALPPEIGQLIHLQILGLNENNFTALPPEIGQLINLKLLDLRNNPLTTLPPEIQQLTNCYIQR